MINTYNDLLVYIKNALARADAVIIDQIPNFVYLAELKLARLPKHLGYKMVVNQVLNKGVAVYAKPNRWRSTVSMNYGTGSGAVTSSRLAVAGVRTLTFAEGHDYSAGQTVITKNIGGTGYNGTVVLTSVSSTSITYTLGSATEALTTDTGGFVTTVQNNVNKILPREYEFCREYWPDDTQTDLPVYYADYDYNNWLIVPTPSQSYPSELVYYEQPLPLSVSNQQNWFTQYAPDALYYGALIEASAYLKNDQRIPIWKSMYDEAMSAIMGEATDRISDASTTRKGGV